MLSFAIYLVALQFFLNTDFNQKKKQKKQTKFEETKDVTLIGLCTVRTYRELSQYYINTYYATQILMSQTYEKLQF